MNTFAQYAIWKHTFLFRNNNATLDKTPKLPQHGKRKMKRMFLQPDDTNMWMVLPTKGGRTLPTKQMHATEIRRGTGIMQEMVKRNITMPWMQGQLKKNELPDMQCLRDHCNKSTRTSKQTKETPKLTFRAPSCFEQTPAKQSQAVTEKNQN